MRRLTFIHGTIVSYLQHGIAGGLWTGGGISSAAAENPPALAIGYSDGNAAANTPAAANQIW